MSARDQFPAEGSPYWVESLADVRHLMRTFARKGEKISVGLAAKGAFVTVALEVGESFIIVDAAKDDGINRLLRGGGATASGRLDGVDVHFELGAAESCEHRGLPALRFGMPPRAHKLQRRESFRIGAPIAKPMECGVDQGGGQRVFATVVDLSLGGLCLRLPSAGFFKAGALHRDCFMEIPGFGALKFDMEVRHVKLSEESGLGEAGALAGCAFVGLPAGAEQSLQKFMARMERDRRALVG